MSGLPGLTDAARSRIDWGQGGGGGTLCSPRAKRDDRRECRGVAAGGCGVLGGRGGAGAGTHNVDYVKRA